eukprot:m.7893 g.7893  ORF g.7893 m.7893 type:complete len:357 (-) comp2485_c0_seq1:1823-2893(-)
MAAAPNVPTFEFDVAGQKGTIPQMGLGTATILGPACVEAVKTALSQGYTMLDTALLYGNQEEVGQGFRESGRTRESVWITSKVGFFPSHDESLWMYKANNVKGEETASIETALKQLQMDYVDLLLIHNPCTNTPEYTCSAAPHWFELFKYDKYNQKDDAINPTNKIFGNVRKYILDAKLAEAKAAADPAKSYEMRKASWLALEKAHREGKAKYIGVSNYTAELLLEMKSYATIFPAVNQLELTPWYASPKLQKVAKELGVVLTAYGTGNSTAIEQSPVVKEIADAVGKSPVAVVTRWTIQSGIVAIPRTAKPAHLKENLECVDWTLSEDAMAKLNALDKDYPYYWWAAPLQYTLKQ